jgi:hypothetical protein
MSNAQPPVNVKYLAEFVDGPLAGQTETRVLVDGEVEKQISSLADVAGAESLYWYVAGETREIEGEFHVKYTLDRKDSDPVTADEEDDSLRF